MKRACVAAMILILGCGVAFSESPTPQLAFLFLDEYVQEKEQAGGRLTGGVISLALGSAAFAGGAVLFFFGDPITEALSPTGEAWDPQTKSIVSGSLAASGALGMGVGMALLLAPPPDYRSRFSHVYSEEDPQLRESLAAAALFDMAEEGKRERILSGVTNIAIPIVSVGLQLGINLATEEEWHKGLTSVSFWQIGTLITGVMSLADRSEEEKLYLRYLAAKSALPRN
jgi:hypothetical protein